MRALHDGIMKGINRLQYSSEMKINVETLFFELIQVAIGKRVSLSKNPQRKDWETLYDYCKKQTLSGIGYIAIQQLPKEQWPPQDVVMGFISIAISIKKQNALLDKTCAQVCQRMEHDGLNVVVLKGQANGLNYPKELRHYRMPGDIDVWCVTKNNEGIQIAVQKGKDKVEYVTCHGVKAVIQYVRMLHRLKDCHKKPYMRYHHIDAPNENGIPVEIHFRPSYKNSPIRNLRLQNWYKAQMVVCANNRSSLGFSVLTCSINVIYLMDHIYRHYFVGGIGLRQLMDYYFALKTWHHDVVERRELQSQGLLADGLGAPVMSREEVMRVLRSFGMGRFAAAVMWVLKEVFAMPTHYFICAPNEKEGRKLLDEIMRGGNFGQYDERGREMKNGGMMRHGVWKLKRVMRLVGSYPEEALWEPMFRLWHWGWRQISR